MYKQMRFHGARMTVNGGEVVRVSSDSEGFEVLAALGTFSEKDRVLVAGGGSGWLAAWIAATSAYVLVLEPLEHWADAIADNVAVEGTPIDVLCGALGLENGEATLHVANDWQESHVGAARESDKGTVRVPVYAVDELVDDHNINALSLDVEGAEYELLLGMDLAPIKKLQLEIHAYRIGDSAVQSIQQRLSAAGFIETYSHARFTTLTRWDKTPTDEVRCIDKAYVHRSILEDHRNVSRQ